MGLRPALLRAKSAVILWNRQFMRELPALKAPEKGDNFGNRLGTGGFGGRTVADETPTAPPLAEKFSDAAKTGAVAGAVLGAGLVILAVASFGTSTPVAMFFGGLVISATTSAMGAFVGPALAVLLGAPIAAIAGLAGLPQPKFPSFPDVTLPKPDLDAAGKKIRGLSGKLRACFDDIAAKKSAARDTGRPPDAPVPPQSLAP